uniref:RimK/LysX family protein n=1 Tax=Roseihalotalea indica TaxID=2867963 RepID=A0AA49GM89_9BACT|nr:RimK/LysX family protein [Tunicatimonas sp. TK19036]
MSEPGKKPQKIIGRIDKIDLPQLKLYNLDAKIDTGAYGSALHAHHIEVIEQEGVETLRFKVLDPTHPEYEDQFFYFQEFTDKKVKSSFGVTEHRYAIRTSLLLFGKRYQTEFSLTDRKDMRYPLLLGRKFLSRGFLVDVRIINASYELKK